MAAILGRRMGIIASIVVVAGAASWGARGQEASPRAKPQAAWTLDEAVAHVQLFPQDAYMQYVALQLARDAGRVGEVASLIERRNPNRNRFAARRGQVNVFSIFSGSLAVQESLQLDAMGADEGVPTDEQLPQDRQGPRPLGAQPTDVPRDSVPVSELVGPTIKSHPWREMLAGRKPEVTGLALQVPADFYFVSFRSVNKLIDAADLTNLWGAHLLNQANRDAKTQLVNDRLREQLAVDVNPALRPFYDAVVDEVAIVGSDLFVRTGSDVTVLFHAKQPAVLRAQMDQFLTNAALRDGAVRTSGQYLGVEYEHVATPDRRIHVYSAYPAPELHVRSNSRAALERVLESITGRDAGGEPVVRLGETDEFRYVRTLMPQGAAEEDGLIYLSDPFVRKLMGPKLRLTERRRMVCYNHLRMIGHAGLMHRTQTGRMATSLADLAEADCAPGVYGQGKFTCPEHGAYTLAADGLTGVCSRHGYASYLTPCLEVENTHVDEAEAEAYRQFLQEYNSYWRQFFDPIAIRLQITPERYRAETIVLPLIDNSIYTGLSLALGGEPEPLDELPVPRRNIFSFAVRLNKERILRESGLEHLLETPPEEAVADARSTQSAIESLRELAVAMLNYESAHKHLPPAASRASDGRPLLSWRVHLLPYLGEGELYREFRLDEPWDSDRNRMLLARMPKVFQGDDESLRKAGKTKFVTLRDRRTVFPPDGEGTALASVTDGYSMTYSIVEADDLHAVPWTKPDDLDVDMDDPTRGLQIRPPGAFLGVMCDGSVWFLRSEADREQLAALFTRAGGESLDWNGLQHARMPNQDRGRGPFGMPDDVIYGLRLGELLSKGIGNQIGFHVYDSEPMFDLSLAQLLGAAVGSMRGGGGFDDDFLMLVPLIGSLNGPVYISIPVKDRAIVDGFLDRLDKWLVNLATQDELDQFFSMEQDFYHLPADGNRKVRAYGFRVGPVKWRFFWSCIGDGLYIASKRDVLDDLALLAANADAQGEASAESQGPGPAPAHGLIRLRPQHWDRVLTAYQLGWEENSREACLLNTGPLSSLSRALASGAEDGDEITVRELRPYAARLYDVHHFCPDGGEYRVLPEGGVACSVHNTVHEPRQTEVPAEGSELGGLLAAFRDAHVTLTFLEDGLHAVATLERSPE
jgi:hypothetical protein